MMRFAASAVAVALLIQFAALPAESSGIPTGYTPTPETAPKHQTSIASYNSDDAADTSDNGAGKKHKHKKPSPPPASPSPSPSPSPTPPPSPKQLPAYSSQAGPYEIPPHVIHYNGWVPPPSTSPKAPVVYDYGYPPQPGAHILAAYCPVQKLTYAYPPKYPPMQCSGNAYCFQNCFPKNVTTPGCPVGWTYNDFHDQCEKFAGYYCPKWTFTDPPLPGGTWKVQATPPVCLTCKPDYVYNPATKQCELPCRSGYDLVLLGTKRWCVARCPANYWVAGDKCVSNNCYIPGACGSNICTQGFSFYYTGLPAAKPPAGKGNYTNNVVTGSNVPEYTDQGGSAYEAYDGKSLHHKKFTQGNAALPCRCCFTIPRDAYLQICEPPSVVTPKVSTLTCPRSCPAGCDADIDGLCHCPCPAGCEAGAQGCCYGCPAGMKMCSRSGRKFCASGNAGMCGLKLDSCDLLSMFYDRLDTGVVCPPPATLAAQAGLPVVTVGAVNPNTTSVTTTVSASAGTAAAATSG